MKQAGTFGLLLLLGYTVSQGLRDVYLSSAFGEIGFFDLVFLAFTSATLFFTALLFFFKPSDFRRLIKEWRGVVAVNVTTAAAWLCYFAALKRIEPSAVSTIFAGVSPIAVFLLAILGLFAADRARASSSERMSHLGVLIVLVFLAWIILTGRSGFSAISWITGLTGVLLAAVSGVVITAETIYAKRMNEAGISAIGVLAFRFVLIAAIGAIAVLGFGNSSMSQMPFSEIGLVTFNILILMVAPLFLVGKGLELTSPMTTGVVAAFGPTVVFSIQAIEGRIPTSYWVLAATILYAVFAISGVALRANAIRSFNNTRRKGLR